MSIARSIIDEHLVSGKAIPGAEIAIRIDQTLTQDATGTMVMLELEEIGLRQIKTELSVSMWIITCFNRTIKMLTIIYFLNLPVKNSESGIAEREMVLAM